MKKVIILILLFTSNFVFSQDLLVTNKYDSIECKVVSTQNSFTIYKIYVDGIQQSRAINNKDVFKIDYNYYLTHSSKLNQVSKIQTKKNPKITSFNAGIGYTSLFDLYREDPALPTYGEYLRELRSSYSLHAEIQHSITKRIGLCFRYDFFKSKAQDNSLQFNYQGSTYYFQVEDEVTIHTLSPGLYYKMPVVTNLMNLNFFTAVDYNFFDNPTLINNISYDVYGQKLGMSFGTSYEYIVNESTAISVQFKFRTSKLDKATYVTNGTGKDEDLEGFDKININRFTIGLNICLK